MAARVLSDCGEMPTRALSTCCAHITEATAGDSESAHAVERDARDARPVMRGTSSSAIPPRRTITQEALQ